MRRPLLSLAGAVILGIAIAEGVTGAPGPLLIAAGVLLLVSLCLILRNAPPWVPFLLLLGAVAATMAVWTAARRADVRSARLLDLLSDEPRLLGLRGEVAGLPEFYTYEPRQEDDPPREETRFLLRVTAVSAGGEWRPCRGLLRMRIGERSEQPTYGDRVELPASVREFGPTLNPGEFDQRGYWMRRGLAGSGWVGAAGAVKVLPGRAGIPGLAAVARLKHRLSEVVRRTVPESEAAIIRCLVLGERTALSPGQEEAFRTTGTMHFLAVSGLHVGLIATLCWWLMLLCGARHRVTAATVLALVLLYAALAGFRPSVQRAAVMCAVFCGGYIFGRRPDFGNSVALALVLILIMEPAELFGPGLQLSFAAVFGIVTFALPLERALFGTPDELDRFQAPEERGWWRHPLRYTIQKLFCVAIVAWLITLPLTMHTFSKVTPCAPLGNVVLIPAVWLVLAAGLPGVLLGGVWPFAAKPFLLLSGLGAALADWVSHILAAVPRVALHVPPPGWWWVILCYLIAVALVYRERLRLTRRRICALLIVLPLLYVGLVWRSPPPKHLEVTAIAVGEGNCMLARFPNGRNLLFDCGSMNRFEVGERVAAPACWAQGVRRIDCAVVSHSDSDHYNGLAGLAERIPVGRVFTTAYFDRNPEEVREFRDALRALNLRPEPLHAGDRIEGLGDVDAQLLWPPASMPFADRLGDNELSIVMRIESDDGSVLFTGDIEGLGAEMLLSRKPDLAADVLQVPHQGRRNPQGVRLAARAGPEAAVIPGGAWAQRPSPYRKAAARLLSTEEHGMIECELAGEKGVTVSTWLDGRASDDEKLGEAEQ